MFAVGLSQGPLHHYFYVFLDRFAPGISDLSRCRKYLNNHATSHLIAGSSPETAVQNPFKKL